MYEMLFIDKNFEEIHDTFFALKKEHIRCYYCNGSSNDVPSNEEEKLPFQYLKFVCLDWCLNNTNHDTNNHHQSIVMLANIIAKFVSNNNYTLIINTSFEHQFALQDIRMQLKERQCCPTVIKVIPKSHNVSVLHKDPNYIAHLKAIRDASQESILRDIILREAIEIENLLRIKIILHLNTIVSRLKPSQYDELGRFNFGGKINLYSYFNHNSQLKEDIQDFKSLRNDWAHNTSPKLVDMLEVLKKSHSIKSRIV